jgi:hypothetical protein
VGLCRGVRDTYWGQNQVGLLFSIGMHITTCYQQRTESVEYKHCTIPQASCYRESINITRQAFKEVRLVQQRGARSARNPRTPADKPLEPGNSKALSTRFW